MIKDQKAAKWFSYLAEPQRTKPWFDIRIGKVTASELNRWMAKSVRGDKPLKSRLDYEAELLYEREFGVSFERMVTSAMQEGTEFEGIVRDRYSAISGNVVDDPGAFYNNKFVASPDGLIGEEGGLEIKVLRDNSFMDVLINGIPESHKLQMQGNMLASGRKWWDYAAANLNTKKIVILRLQRSEEDIDKIKKSLESPFYTDSLKMAVTITHELGIDNDRIKSIKEDLSDDGESDYPW